MMKGVVLPQRCRASAATLARHCFFQPALFRRLIISESHEYRRPQLKATLRGFVSPLGKLDFGDKFRAHKKNFSQSANLAVKRILFRLERLQESEDLFERLLIEARAHLPDVNEAPLPVIQPKHQRAEIFAAAFGRSIASDDALLALRDFYFEPVARALFFVGAATLLGDDAFQFALLRRLEKLETFLSVVVGKMNDFAVFNSVLQQPLALFERDAAQVHAIEVQQIERIVNDPDAFAPRQSPFARLEPGPLLHQTKRRAALFIERDDLAVKDGALGFYELRQAPKFGKLRREVVLVARHQTHAPVFNEGDGAVAVPFDFEQPVRIVEGLRRWE